jgi:hypothetical protein
MMSRRQLHLQLRSHVRSPTHLMRVGRQDSTHATLETSTANTSGSKQRPCLALALLFADEFGDDPTPAVSWYRRHLDLPLYKGSEQTLRQYLVAILSEKR